MKLFIDDQFCPTQALKSLPIDFSIDKLTDPQRARESKQCVVTILSTPTTDAIFYHAKDLYAVNRFNSEHHTARLEVNGITLFQGTACLLSSSITSSHSGLYTIRIVSQATHWAVRAAKTQLKECGLTLNMPLLPQYIQQTWEGVQDVRFLPVLRNRYIPKYSNVSATPVEIIMTADDYHPFISVPSLFNKIFEGYSVESEFLKSSDFIPLLISGQYANPDTSRQQALLGFFARRSAPSSAVSDSSGKVVADPYDTTRYSLGNIVDTADPTAIDSYGKVMHDTFSIADAFAVDQTGCARFYSAIAANVGFLLHLEYTTPYYITSRKALEGFNRIGVDDTLTAEFTIANTFTDNRKTPVAGLTYNLCIFDFVQDDLYLFRVEDAVTHKTILSKSISSRWTQITIPEGCQPICHLELMLGEKVETDKDWALYNGWVSERGNTEVVVELRIPPKSFAAEQSYKFNKIWFAGAGSGQTITISTACSIRPYFSNVPGFGSTVTFDDITHNSLWMIDIVDAICKMFNLVIFTDEERKRVVIEPMEHFYTNKEWDWSHKIDLCQPIDIADLGVDMPQWTEHKYINSDYATQLYNEQNGESFGCWRHENPTYGATNTTKAIVSPLFTTGINRNNIYAVAPSASIMQVGDDAAEGAMDRPFSTHIVSYAGLCPLPEDERWGSPLNTSKYPLAAFHFAGDQYTKGFSLCFEDRDGVKGLNRFFKEQVERTATKERVTLTLNLTPFEIEQLFEQQQLYPTLRDTFRLSILNNSSRYRLESIRNYSVEEQKALCTFIRLTND